MLSPQEYEDTLWKFNNIPSNITGKPRQNLRQTFRKKLIEHKYASNYPPFTPLSYGLFFINYRTSEDTLRRLIDAINYSTIFTLDTESVEVYKQPNKPALIQLQIINRETHPYILIVEVNHLPPTNTTAYKFTQQLFESLFQAGKKIFIWGTINELKKFTTFNLFSSEQICLSENINIQNYFKGYWHTNHPHISTSSTTNNIICICEACIGIEENNPWSLQDAVAYQLNQWLDKRLTRSPFNIGLDPALVHLNSNELEYRQLLTRYASNDCDAIYQLIISMDLIEQQQSPIQPSNQVNHTPTINENMNYELEPISADDEEPHITEENPNERHNKLSAEERRRIHNRTCTLKQRIRYFKHEIIIKNTDRRFSIREIKGILRNKNISFYAVKPSTSPRTHRRTLSIGIRDPSKLSLYKTQTQGLFTEQHFQEFHSAKRAKYHRRHPKFQHNRYR